MIIPDVNILVYAYNMDAPHHTKARTQWENLLSGPMPVGLPWAVCMGFLRIMTDHRILTDPIGPVEAIEHIKSWFECSNVHILEPGPLHLEIVGRLVSVTGTAGRLTTDTHLAALAIEFDAEVYSNDGDFKRFPGLRLHNPFR